MARKNRKRFRPPFSSISISGYKSISSKQSMGVAPLTILAGTNSSGKSSFMQPILLMKQTMEESYDPGALLLTGPNVQLTSANQLLTRNKIDAEMKGKFGVTFDLYDDEFATVYFKKQARRPGFIIDKWEFKKSDRTFIFSPESSQEDISEMILTFTPFMKPLVESALSRAAGKLEISRNRCFYDASIRLFDQEPIVGRMNLPVGPSEAISETISSLIHLPGLRRNPERNYPTTAFDSDYTNKSFPGTFDKYVASIITLWQRFNKKKLHEVQEQMARLNLTSKVSTQSINDAEVELLVGTKSGQLVSIADVGLGVSQSLPVVVALLFAEPGQIVYVEQPELHLHPRAQYEMAYLLVEAANRGVTVVVETHSSILIRGVQTAVAAGKIKPKSVLLHWFSLDENSKSEIDSSYLDKDGSFGEWPSDFDDIALMAEMSYLEAVEKQWGIHDEEGK